MRRLGALLVVLGVTACGDGGGERADEGGLGGNAIVKTLAAQELTGPAPPGVRWIAHELRLERGGRIEHAHEPAFVYAREAGHRLTIEGEASELEERAGAAVPGAVRHVHEGAQGSPSVFWEVRLARAGSRAPSAAEARTVFESEPVEGAPPQARAVFVYVLLPPGGATSVHTHPGSELIYQLTGRIDYQNALVGTIRIGPGALEGIPPETAVQKRNPSATAAEFLSWFLVDPERPFASPAGFGE